MWNVHSNKISAHDHLIPLNEHLDNDFIICMLW